jgi:hypothetical protein
MLAVPSAAGGVDSRANVRGAVPVGVGTGNVVAVPAVVDAVALAAVGAGGFSTVMLTFAGVELVPEPSVTL